MKFGVCCIILKFCLMLMNGIEWLVFFLLDLINKMCFVIKFDDKVIDVLVF